MPYSHCERRDEDSATLKADLLRAGRAGDVPRALQLLQLIDGGTEAPLTPIGETVLGVACAAGTLPLVSALLDLGANPSAKDSRGATCLLIACASGQAHIARRLLQAIASLAAAETAVTDIYGTAPLHRAVGFGHVQCVEALLEYGADVNLSTSEVTAPEDYGAGTSRHETALHMAVRLPSDWGAWSRRRELINILLAHGADPLCKDRRGDTPLHFCARYQQSWCFCTLLAAVPDSMEGLRAANHDKTTVMTEVEAVGGLMKWVAWVVTVAAMLNG